MRLAIAAAMVAAAALAASGPEGPAGGSTTLPAGSAARPASPPKRQANRASSEVGRVPRTRDLPQPTAAPAASRLGGEPASRPAGIAAWYPGDVGIERDPAVILHEDFEGPDLDRKKWTDISSRAGALKLTAEPANVHGGRGALQATATLEKNTGGHLFVRFGQGYERMHSRFCVNPVNTVWFDDVVVATDYIGPPTKPSR